MKIRIALSFLIIYIFMASVPAGAAELPNNSLVKYCGKYSYIGDNKNGSIDVINANSKKAVRLTITMQDKKGGSTNESGIAIFIKDNIAKYVSDSGCSVILEFSDNQLDVIEKGEYCHVKRLTYEGIYKKN
jgi:VCBS repeat-containing protein